MRIERICPNEAEALYNCMKKIDQETQYMLYLPDERSFDKAKLIEDIKRHFYIGVKTENDEILGYLSVHISTLAKVKHIGYIMTGLINDLHQQGLATQMFNETIKWAERKGLRSWN
nr:GNAT family N-acetyltransferase [Staphylococcus edaphicus]